jgi:hypothetical protein
VIGRHEGSAVWELKALRRTSAEGRIYEMLTNYLFGYFTALYQLLSLFNMTLVVHSLTYLPTNERDPGTILTAAANLRN